MRTKILILLFIILNLTFYPPWRENCVGQWVQMSNGMGNYRDIHALAISVNNVFAGAGNYNNFDGVWFSTNNGQNWTQTALNNKCILSLATNGNNIFAGTYANGIWLSTNNGQNWTQVGLNNKYVTTFAISGNNIFAGTYDSGVYLSTNNGQNWTQTGLINKSVFSLAISGNYIFAGTYAYGVFRSANNGQNWTAAGLINKSVYGLTINGNNIFAGTTYGVWLSTNNGQNWILTTSLDQNIFCLANSGYYIFAGCGQMQGIILTTNNGQNWNAINQGFPLSAEVVLSLLIANNYIFAGTSEHSIWRRPLSDFTGIKNISTEMPSAFSLEQNYPNPFNQSTMFNVKCSMAGMVKVSVYDISGKEVAILINEKLQPGVYSVRFDAGNLPSGIYFYRLQTENYTATKKLILLK